MDLKAKIEHLKDITGRKGEGMRTLIIEISEPTEEGVIQLTTKKVGDFANFEIVGILEAVKHNFMCLDQAPLKKKRGNKVNT